jgi:hypothetical protein
VITRRSYDGQGNLKGYTTYKFGRTRRGPGCLTTLVAVFMGSFLLFWPLDFLGTAGGDAVAVVYWGAMFVGLVALFVHLYRKAHPTAPVRPPVTAPVLPPPKPTHTAAGTPLTDLRASDLRVSQARYSDRR